MSCFLKALFSVVLLFTLHGILNNAIAATDPPYIKRLDGAKGEIKKDSLMTVRDNNFYNSGLSPWITKPYYERNIVTLKINEDSSFYLPSPFTATVVVKITYLKYRSLTDSSIIVRNDTLTINYDSTKTYTGMSSFVFDSAQGMQVKILGVAITNTSKPSQVLKSLILEAQVQPFTDYTWSCTANVNTTIALDNNTSRINSTGEMLTSWPNVFGADEYDLEWAFIDQVALNDTVYGNPVSPDSAFVARIFANNATRITTSKLSYGIPLIFPDTGTLYVRVRPVQIKPDGSRITSVWSSKYLPNGLGTYYFTGHENKVNWQSATSFAEDGKRKVVVQYFDGSLRGRQTASKDNNLNVINVAETFYDYQGRPVIQVLPAPSLSNAIKYSQLFNVANTGEYDKRSYDTLYNFPAYDSAAPEMSTDSGASRYYSSSNPYPLGIDKFIPDANKYPFTETRYTQDNTGRISRQGGVGPNFQLGSGHETKYYYASPDQDELDALFGTEVGDKSHYFKNAVQDANGQFSISYVDMHGRTIATALAGDSVPGGMDTLKSFNKRTDVVKKLSDPNSTVIKGLTMESHGSLLVTGMGNYEFKYHLDPQSFTSQACDDSTICYNCLYDLKITITDDGNNQKLPGKKPYVVTISKGSLVAVNDTCNKASITLDTTFSLPLTPGTYEVTKQLTVSKYANDFYRDNVFMTKNACTTKEQFIQQARAQLTTGCTPTYAACRDSLGTFAQFYSRYINAAGIDPATMDTTGLSKTVWLTYVDAQRACYELGDTLFSEYDDIRRDMLMDVTAPYGQYANPDSTQDIYSVFHLVSGQTYRVYQTPSIQYKNEYGIPDTVVDDNGNRVLPKQLEVQQFAKKFKTSWADALLPYHPEYCRLQRLEADTASLRWNKKFEKTETYSDAVTNGFMNPFVSPASDPVPAVSMTPIQNKWQWYVTQNGKTLSMEQFAVMSAKCSDSTCAADYFNNPKKIDSITGCNGDKDNAWRIYRNLYLAAKKQVMDSLVNVSVVGEGCTITAHAIITAHRFPHFYNSSDAISQSGYSFFMSAPNKEVLLDSANRRMDSFYTQNCRAYAQLWISQLKTCSVYTQIDIDNIIPQLVAVCAEGSDVDHPFGSRSSATSSFESVINSYNVAHGISTSEFCNPDLISYPGYYDKQNLAVDKPIYSKPDSCLCNKLNQYYAEYSNFSSYYTSLSDFFLKRYNTVINESEYISLMSMCSGSNKCNFLLNPATLPPILQCNSATSCVNCSDVKTLYDAFSATYDFTPTRDETDTAHQRRNKLFTNYMNSRLGFNKQAWEYIDFIEKCEGIVTSKCVGCDSLQSLINGYFNQSDVYGGSESAMLTYIKNQLGAKGLSTDTINIRQALETCNNSWKRNIAFRNNSIFNFKGEDSAFSARALGKNLEIGANGSNFAIEFWANLNSNQPGFQFLLVHGESGNYYGGWPGAAWYYSTDTIARFGYRGYFVNYANGQLYFGMSDNNSSNTTTCHNIKVRTPISTGIWHHIVIRRTGTGKYASDIKIYIDKQLSSTTVIDGCDTIANGSIVTEPIGNPGLRVFGGADFQTTSPNPLMKNLRLYNRALDTTEIAYNYHNCDGAPMDTTSLRLWAKFNEPGQRPKDYSNYHTVGKYYNEGDRDTNGNLIYVDTTLLNNQSWKGGRGPVVTPSCIVHIENVLCNFPDTVLLCNNSAPYNSDFNQTSNCSDSMFLAASLGIERYNDYTDSLRNNFDSLYYAKCLQAYKYESFTVTHPATEFHYTLYYYDQAGNLVKTVPPQGVVPNRNGTWLQQVKAARANGTTLVPTYFFATEYRYNSLNQVIAQTTPDAGLSKFFYDRLGRLVLSQNLKQAQANNYSYTKYDYIGRITEVGQIKNSEAMDRVISRTQSQLDSWFIHADASRTEITKTVYDQPYLGSPASLVPLLVQANLRNRVSWTAVYNKGIEADTLNPVAATYYSYDIHGNVDTLLQDYKSAMDTSNRFKKMVYDYDLVSGKVNMVSYQPGKRDQFYHRYTYDAENRLTDVETSSDRLYWEHDAFYSYYKHGPLNKMLLGKQQVQGIDYAYTLQGWLKGINSTSLLISDDIGGDGRSLSGVAANPVARDVLGLALEYYGYNDYEPIDATKKPFANGYATTAFKPLHNGNIAGISLNIQAPVTNGVTIPAFYNYTYDQLNRLTKQQANIGLNTSSNTWSLSPQDDYRENVSYDANGNIIGYLRNGTSSGGNRPAMDSLLYHYYYAKTNGQIGNYVPSFLPADAARLTNKLAYISDTVSAANYTVDIDNQTNTTNYIYDSIGNLTKDVKENIDSIHWNVYGKITQINKSDGTVIKYGYDAAGNRISKTVGAVKAIYVRDASGNVMSVYVSGDTANAGHLTQSEVHLYGSSRLGLLRPNIDMTGNQSMPGVGSKYFTTFIRGRKLFEITNHLGNVLATVTDKKTGIKSTSDTSKVAYYLADVASAQDYYPFGMLMPGRSYSSGTLYRFGFNGKENDNEVKGTANQQDYGMRIYDPRLARFLSVDPLTQEYPFYAPYQFAGNMPIKFIDLDGLEPALIPNDIASDPELLKAYTDGAKKSLNKVLTFTDVNDATVITTSFTRKKAINVDGTNASGTDKTFAYIGVAVPVVSGSAIAKTVKGISRGSKWLYNSIKYGTKVADALQGGSTALREALEKTGLDLAGKEAHHLIPIQLLKENKVVQGAVNAGFDFNGLMNGIGLTKVAEGGVHANHPNYTKQIVAILTDFEKKNSGYKPEDAKEFLEGLADRLKQFVKKESADGGKKVNELVIPR